MLEKLRHARKDLRKVEEEFKDIQNSLELVENCNVDWFKILQEDDEYISKLVSEELKINERKIQVIPLPMPLINIMSKKNCKKELKKLFGDCVEVIDKGQYKVYPNESDKFLDWLDSVEYIIKHL